MKKSPGNQSSYLIKKKTIKKDFGGNHPIRPGKILLTTRVWGTRKGTYNAHLLIDIGSNLLNIYVYTHKERLLLNLENSLFVVNGGECRDPCCTRVLSPSQDIHYQLKARKHCVTEGRRQGKGL